MPRPLSGGGRKSSSPERGLRAPPSDVSARRAFLSQHKLKKIPRPSNPMKRVQIWENHVRIPHLDLVLVRPATETLAKTLGNLSRMGIGVDEDDVEVHGRVRTD